MAMNDPPDPLARATEAMRRTEEPGWVGLSGHIMNRVRSAVRPSEPLLTYAADGGVAQDEAGSRTWVAARLVTTALRDSLRTAAYAPSDIAPEIQDEQLDAVSVELVCSYGTDLLAAGGTARRTVEAVLADLLGSRRTGPPVVTVEVVDVVLGDPRQT